MLALVPGACVPLVTTNGAEGTKGLICLEIRQRMDEFAIRDLYLFHTQTSQ